MPTSAVAFSPLRPEPLPVKVLPVFAKLIAAVNVSLLFKNATFGGRFDIAIIPLKLVVCSGTVKNIAFVALLAVMERIA